MTTYHVAIRRLADHTDAWEWHLYEGHAMDYHEARRFMLGLARFLPALHQPHAPWYLTAEPMRGQQ